MRSHNYNQNIPDNIYQLKDRKWRGGSKQQDLNALAGILMAWQIGVKEYKFIMKSGKNRRNYVEDFVKILITTYTFAISSEN